MWRWLAVFLLWVIQGCSSGVVIERSASSVVKPKWVMHTPTSSKRLYFVGLHQEATSLAEGRQAAFKDALGKVATYVGSELDYVFSEHVTDHWQDIDKKLTTRSRFQIENVVVEDSYHESLRREERNFSWVRYDVFVLVSLSQVDVAEIRRKSDVVIESHVAAAFEDFKSAEMASAQKQIKRAVTLFRQVIERLEPYDKQLVNAPAPYGNNVKLLQAARHGLDDLLKKARRVKVVIDVRTDDFQRNTFLNQLRAQLSQRDFLLVEDAPVYVIEGSVTAQSRGFVLGNYVYYTQGEVRIREEKSREVLEIIALSDKGVHQSSTQAAIRALDKSAVSIAEQVGRLFTQ